MDSLVGAFGAEFLTDVWVVFRDEVFAKLFAEVFVDLYWLSSGLSDWLRIQQTSQMNLRLNNIERTLGCIVRFVDFIRFLTELLADFLPEFLAEFSWLSSWLNFWLRSWLTLWLNSWLNSWCILG